jgi:phosphoglycerate dehydrogenase-like enzyme
VIVTPHVSGNFDQYTSRVINLFIENLRRFLKGDSLLYHFDRSAGY